MDVTGYITLVHTHLDGMGVESRPSREDCIEAWGRHVPPRRMAETFKRRLGRAQTDQLEDEFEDELED